MLRIKRFFAIMATAGSFFFATSAHADFINVALNTFNVGSSPTGYSFSFLTPTTLTGHVSFSGTLFINLTDQNGNGVSVSPIGGFLMQGLIGGVAVGNDTLGVVAADVPPYLAFSGDYDCGAGCNTISLLLNYTLSAGDIAAFAATFTVLPATAAVPEPGTLLLLGIGAAGFLLARTGARRRRFAAATFG